MSVKLRLARIGTKHVPMFRVVAMDSRKKRDGRFLDNLGTYNAATGELIQFDGERFNYWLSQGAVSSDMVKKIFKKFKTSGLSAKTPKAVAPVEVAVAEAESAQEPVSAE